MPTEAIMAKRDTFRREVVEPHMATCPVCQAVLAEEKGLLVALSTDDFPDDPKEWEWLPVDEAALDAEEDRKIQQSWEEYERGMYYALDEGACTIKCPELDAIFKTYFSTCNTCGLLVGVLFIT